LLDLTLGAAMPEGEAERTLDEQGLIKAISGGEVIDEPLRD